MITKLPKLKAAMKSRGLPVIDVQAEDPNYTYMGDELPIKVRVESKLSLTEHEKNLCQWLAVGVPVVFSYREERT